MTTEKTKTTVDPFEEAMKNYEAAFKAGLKMQEDAAKWWTGVVTKAPSVDTWQKKATTAANEAFPTIQKLMDDSLRVVEQSTKSSLELFKQGMETVQSTSVAESQNRIQKLWESSLQTLQSNAQAMAQLNSKVMESWLGAVRKAAEYAEPAHK